MSKRRGSRTGALPSAALDALGDANRRAIVEILAAAPSSVQTIADQLPISRPAVSRHLRLLKSAALVEDRAVGTQRVYALRPEGVQAIRDYFEQLWGDVAARFRLAAENTRPDRPA
jgi:DNA-binding transcriptional ArsR family regulator